MTATYNATDNTLKELPGMEKPLKGHFIWTDEQGELRYNTTEFDYHLAKYDEHLATLRTIPCSPECRGLWAEGQNLEEGKDYEVRECRTWTQNGQEWGCAECCWGDRCDEDCDATYRRPNCPFCKGGGWFKEQPLFAFPLPVKSEQNEDDLWQNLFLDLYLRDWNKETIQRMKQKYIITKR